MIVFNIAFIVVLLSIAIQGSLLPFFSRKFNMIDEEENVLKTFNDYSDTEDVDFITAEIGEAHKWVGKQVKNLEFMPSVLLVLIIRNGQNIIPNGDTVIEKGDRVPMVPRLKATLGVKYNFTDRLSGYLNYVYLAKQESRELRENPDISKDDIVIKHTIGGHGTLEAGLSYKPDNYSDIKIGAKNILSNK